MIKKLNNERGATALIWVILIFISAIIITGFVNIMTKTLSINEVQGIMDMSGVLSLRYAADEEHLRSEESLLVDTSVAKNKFKQTVDSQLSEYTGDRNMFNSYNIEEVSILKDTDTFLGAPIQGKGDYFLESVVTVSYKTSSIIDSATIHAVSYFDFLWAGENASISIRDDGGDGETNVVIRSLSRLSLR